MQVSEPLEECSIGAKLSDQECGLGLPLSSLSGQLGCIYLFEAPLSEGALLNLRMEVASNAMSSV